jgi:hypothetical protein
MYKKILCIACVSVYIHIIKFQIFLSKIDIFLKAL